MCDSCNKHIPGEFFKVSNSKMISGIQKLTHVGDLCEKCWNKVIGN